MQEFTSDVIVLCWNDGDVQILCKRQKDVVRVCRNTLQILGVRSRRIDKVPSGVSLLNDLGYVAVSYWFYDTIGLDFEESKQIANSFKNIIDCTGLDCLEYKYKGA